MKNYLFYDYDSGEHFIVETDTKEKAYLCAYTYFKDPKFCEEVSYFEAELLGLDVYQKGVKMNKYIILNERGHIECSFKTEYSAHKFIREMYKYNPNLKYYLYKLISHTRLD